MALDAEFLNGIFADEEMQLEDKVKKILSESEADNRGLIQKRDELLGKNKKLGDEIKAYEEKESEWSGRITSLEEELKNNSPEQHKQFYESQLAEKQKKFDADLANLASERDFYKTSHLQRLMDDAIAEGVKDIRFIDGLKDGFIANVLVKNDFEVQEIDGEIMFLNKHNKTIQDVIHDFSLSPEGKAYIKNPTSGGNAHSSNNSFSSSTSGNGKTVLTRDEYNELVKDPAKFAEFRATHKSWSVE